MWDGHVRVKAARECVNRGFDFARLHMIRGCIILRMFMDININQTSGAGSNAQLPVGMEFPNI